MHRVRRITNFRFMHPLGELGADNSAAYPIRIKRNAVNIWLVAVLSLSLPAAYRLSANSSEQVALPGPPGKALLSAVKIETTQ
jgi:hypothetical protein